MEIADLARRMNVPVESIRIRDKFLNAYVIGKSVVLGRDLLDRLDVKQCLGVVAHEFAHIKGKHGLIQALLLIPFLFSAIRWLDLPPAICTIALLAYITILMIPVSWYFEVQADKTAVEFVGKETLVSALSALANEETIDEQTEDHPSIRNRIRLIEKL